MRIHRFTTILFLAMLCGFAGCAASNSVRHQYLMRGQILEMTNGTAYLCIGSSEGAKVGQEYDVYRFEKAESPGKQQSSYKREKTGAVKIIEIVDEHFARAEVVSGEVKENLFVELKP